MGPSVITTNNLILRVENENQAKNVLDMYLRNKASFEAFEPTRPHDFYTLAFHEQSLRREYKAYNLGTFLRYYIYYRKNPHKIIGAVNFNITYIGEEKLAEIGYKLDTLYQNRGYTFEACYASIQVMSEYYGINRIDARIHPDNAPSICLARKLGFKYLTYEPKSANILGKTVDINRYTLDISSIQ